jgi:hypothetical protein
MLQTQRLPELEREIHPQVPGAPDYHFLKCVGRGPLGETWHIRTADGRHRLAQFLPPGDHKDALKRLRSIRSDGLVPLEIVCRSLHQPFLVTPLPARALQHRLEECWRQGLSGIPRAELHSYVRQVAETLDDLFLRYRLQHLWLRPDNVILEGQKALLSGFAWLQLFWQPTGQPYELLAPSYAAPELHRRCIHAQSDQYSLALIYAEMATGFPRFRAPLTHVAGSLRRDLLLLPSEEREILSRALSPDPAQRLISLPLLAAALERAAGKGENAGQKRRREILIPYAPAGFPESPGVILRPLDSFDAELVALAVGAGQVRRLENMHYRLEAGRQLEHHFAVQHVPGAGTIGVEGFRRHWRGEMIRRENDVLLLKVHPPLSFWHVLTGRRVGLEIQVRLCSSPGARLGEVHVVIRPFGCEHDQAVRLLDEVGPQVLHSLRAYLMAQTEQRSNERLAYNQTLRVCPVINGVDDGVELAEAIPCVAKDISRKGIGFYLPKTLSAAQVYVNVPDVPALASMARLAHIVRKRSCGGGWYEVGASFAPPPSPADE